MKVKVIKDFFDTKGNLHKEGSTFETETFVKGLMEKIEDKPKTKKGEE